MIHRSHAEQTAGAVTPLPSEFAADGVAELLETMSGGQPPPWGSFTPSGQHTAVELNDAGERIRVATGVFEGTHRESGTRCDEAHLLRVDGAGITVEGDQIADAEWRSAMDQPLE